MKKAMLFLCLLCSPALAEQIIINGQVIEGESPDPQIEVIEHQIGVVQPELVRQMEESKRLIQESIDEINRKFNLSIGIDSTLYTSGIRDAVNSSLTSLND